LEFRRVLFRSRTPGYYDRRELFKGRTQPLFDPIAAAEAHIQQTADLLFHPARFERVSQQQMMNKNMPGVIEIYAKPIVDLYKSIKNEDYASYIARLTAQTLLEELLATAHSDAVSIVAQHQAKKALSYIVEELQKSIKKSSRKAGDTNTEALK